MFAIGIAAVGVIATVGMLYWKDIYCHLFLDPRLVGKWKVKVAEVTDVEILKFDRVGNIQGMSGGQPILRGTYRILGNSLILAWQEEDGPNEITYRIEGNLLKVEIPNELKFIYHRVPDE